MLSCLEILPVTTTIATRKPQRRKRWTYADYCKIPRDRKRHEIIDGRHYVTPSPELFHQAISKRLLFQLMDAIEGPELGLVFCAPLDLHLGRGTVVQPDLIVVAAGTEEILGDKKLTGVPDMVVEILSPSTRGHDRRRKKQRYERAGIREFWIVDPETRQIEQFVLHNGRYGVPKVATRRLRLEVLPGVGIDLASLFAPPMER